MGKEVSQMEVEVLSNGLERRMTIAVPAQQYDQEITNRLKSLSRRVKVDGFRAGKVPLKVVERRWGSSVREEVRDALMNSSFYEAISKENLRPAGTPNFEVQQEDSGEGLRYIAVFEVYPEFEVQMPSEFNIEKPVTTINEDDIDKMVETLRKHRLTWEAVTRGAQMGDRIVMDFKGTLNGEDFTGNSANDYAVVLGSGTLLTVFDDNLLGLAQGQEKGFDIEFPKDYHATDLAGKQVHFDVKVHSVATPQLPELNEEFFRSFGVSEGGMAAFRDEVKATMSREVDRAIKERVKLQVMDALIATNPIQLPKALVEDERKRIQEHREGPDIAAQGTNDNDSELQKRAERRVALGLIVAEIVKKNQFKAAPDKVRAAVENIASSYEVPSEVVKWYYAHRDHLMNVEALVLEDQVADWLIQQAEVSEKQMAFDKLVNPS
jgi:trigger factor